MFKILDKLKIGNMQLLKNGLKLYVENRNFFEIETIAITHYKNTVEYTK